MLKNNPGHKIKLVISGAPIRRRPRNNEPKVHPPSPTRSEGTGVASEENPRGLEAVSMPTLLAQTAVNGHGEVITTVVKSDMTHVLRKLRPAEERPDSPDVTRAAKKLELSKNNHLGAIAKVRSRGLESPTTSTSSSTTSNASSSQK